MMTMTNEMKLLMAFVEASGFEVETSERDGPRYFGGYENTMGGQVAKYTVDTIIDYKVTKKELEGVKLDIREYIPSLGYLSGEMVNYHGGTYKSLHGGTYNKNFSPVTDPSSWAQMIPWSHQ